MFPISLSPTLVPVLPPSRLVITFGGASVCDPHCIYWHTYETMGIASCDAGYVDFHDSLPALILAMDFEYGSGCYELVEIVSDEQYQALFDSGAFYREPD